MHHPFIAAICPQRAKSLKSESAQDCRVSLHLGKKGGGGKHTVDVAQCCFFFFCILFL